MISLFEIGVFCMDGTDWLVLGGGQKNGVLDPGLSSGLWIRDRRL
jgi:hypothetical protein